MGMDIPAPAAGIGGGALLVGGGALAVTGGRNLASATALDQFATMPKLLPTLESAQKAMDATDDMLAEVQYATRNGTSGLFGKFSAAKELSKVDESRLVGAAKEANLAMADLLVAVEGDLPKIPEIRLNAQRAGIRIGAGVAIAALGAGLVLSSAFDIE